MFGECFPLDAHSHFAQAISRFLVCQAFVRRFCFSSGTCSTFFLCLPPEVAEVGFLNHESESLCWGYLLEKVCRRIVVVPASSPASLCLHGFPLRLTSFCVIVGQDRVAVLEIAVRSPHIVVAPGS